MNFEKIYNEVLAMYPMQIDVSDGRLIEEINGFESQNLKKTLENSEYNATLKGEWYSLLVWVIFQVLHEKAKTSFLENIFLIKRNVDRKLFREFLVTNLDQEAYQDMKNEFINYEQKHGRFA